MKIIGLMMVWRAETWVDLSIKQALELCDEVIISISPPRGELYHYQDKTEEIVLRHSGRVKIVEPKFGRSISETRAATLNKMLRTADYLSVDNWVWLLDVDEFYSREGVRVIKEEVIPEGYDSVIFGERFFYINMTKHLNTFRTDRLWKIRNTDIDFFRPTNWWQGEIDNPFILQREIGVFHYSLLTNPRSKRDQWVNEYNTLEPRQATKVQWLDEVYLRFNLDDEDYWVLENLKIFGHFTPFWMSDFDTNSGKLFEYTGRHPDIIEESGLTKVQDFRSFYD